jgi:hypothetical protein
MTHVLIECRTVAERLSSPALEVLRMARVARSGRSRIQGGLAGASAFLKTLYRGRNEISHELDLQRPEQPGDRNGRTRPIGPTKNLCQEGLEVAQLMVNAVGVLMRV